MVLSCFQGSGDSRERSDVKVNGTACVWATPKPHRTDILHLLFVGLDGSGKSTAIRTLVRGAPAPQTEAHSSTPTILLPPPPTTQGQCSYVQAAGNLIPSAFVAVEAPGAAAQRAGWGDAMSRCDGVVVVVDASDAPRFPVLREWVWRLLPRMVKRAAPCVVLATSGTGVLAAVGSSGVSGAHATHDQQQRLVSASTDRKQQQLANTNMDDIIAELDLPTLFSALPAPWAVRAGSAQDWGAVAEAAGWVLAQLSRMRAVPLQQGGPSHPAPASTSSQHPHPRIKAACQAVNADFAALFAATRALQQQQLALGAAEGQG